eukprot:SAG11_NODE_24636_length_370_cov_1.077491_1_plen_30_part_10
MGRVRAGLLQHRSRLPPQVCVITFDPTTAG